MKLLLDQGLPRAAVGLLCASGHDAIHVGDIGMAGADDTTILAHARLEQRIVVTLDADFHALLAIGHATQPSVIRIRIEGLKGPELSALLSTVLGSCREALSRGAVVSVRKQATRVHYLPLV